MAAVEFAAVGLVFLLTVFGILELARIVYMYNTLADVTRSAARAAANIDWRRTDDLNQAKRRAIFRDSPGALPFGAPVTDQNIRIDYMYLKKVGSTITKEQVPTMPVCPGRNRHNCLTNYYGNGDNPETVCVRLVRVRICQTASGNCDPVAYQPLMRVLDLGLDLPLSTTIVPVETLGYRPGDSVCQ